VSVDWVDQPVWMLAEEVHKMHLTINKLREDYNIPKKVIATADFGIYWTQKLIQNGDYWAIEQAIKRKGDPAWEVMLYVEP